MQTNFQNSAQCGQKPFVFRDDKPILDIRYDNVFKAVFTRDNAESKGALSSLISALIEKQVSVETIQANEPPVDGIGQRNIRFDISCKTQSGELVNIEMSLYPKADELERIEYYDPINRVSLNGKTRIIIMELVKAAKVIEKSADEMSGAEAWAAFFEYLTDKGKSEKITEIVNHEGGIAMAASALFNITDDEREYARVTSELKYELDHQSDMVHAKRQGIQQGLQQGVHQGRLETSLEYTQKMKALGLSSEQIQAVTGLSEQQIRDI
ncbi:MAG: Rpn family recombination-promoting nuclease/putative transposase [Treponema sp.]|jgi:hypothetical protein|nr:Rpn family recombination-promoting nuclease/putative transposase [Treponema sp.]